MSGVNKQNGTIVNSSDGDAKCFFCNCTEHLKGFKNFFICVGCVNAAQSICEEDRK